MPPDQGRSKFFGNGDEESNPRIVNPVSSGCESHHSRHFEGTRTGYVRWEVELVGLRRARHVQPKCDRVKPSPRLQNLWLPSLAAVCEPSRLCRGSLPSWRKFLAHRSGRIVQCANAIPAIRETFGAHADGSNTCPVQITGRPSGTFATVTGRNIPSGSIPERSTNFRSENCTTLYTQV